MTYGRARWKDPRFPMPKTFSRRRILKGIMASVATSAALPGFLARPVAAQELPPGVGDSGRRTLIRGGHILSQDAGIGKLTGDVLIEGKKIIEIAGMIEAPDAVVIDATGRIVMPGFVDTHHHQFETALR